MPSLSSNTCITVKSLSVGLFLSGHQSVPLKVVLGLNPPDERNIVDMLDYYPKVCPTYSLNPPQRDDPFKGYPLASLHCTVPRTSYSATHARPKDVLSSITYTVLRPAIQQCIQYIKACRGAKMVLPLQVQCNSICPLPAGEASLVFHTIML